MKFWSGNDRGPTLCYVTVVIACWKYFSLISVWYQKYLLQFLGIWFIKATTEEWFSLTRTKPHSLQEGIGLIM